MLWFPPIFDSFLTWHPLRTLGRWCVSSRSLQGEEGQAPFLSDQIGSLFSLYCCNKKKNSKLPKIRPVVSSAYGLSFAIAVNLVLKPCLLLCRCWLTTPGRAGSLASGKSFHVPWWPCFLHAPRLSGHCNDLRRKHRAQGTCPYCGLTN